MIKLIVGLGNPGRSYEQTRHNVGFWLIDSLAQQQAGVVFRNHTKFSAAVAKLDGCPLLKPTTFVNDSGQAVSAYTKFYQLKPPELLVIHDDLDLPTGSIRLKFDGGHAGHNGLRSIIQHIGQANFYRFRIGIGHPGHKDRVISYVLSAPPPEERTRILEAIHAGIMTLPELMQGHTETAMQILHSRSSS